MQPAIHEHQIGFSGTRMIDSIQHQAIHRLFDLSCRGEVENMEFAQLDSMVYAGLERTYPVDEPDSAQDAPRPIAS
jgi:hypothetical protein